MRRLVVCADGTWNKPDNDDHGIAAPTNVVKVQRGVKAMDDTGVSQIVYYHSGVGTGDLFDKLGGGAIGDGLDRNIRECYEFLVNNYHPGDELYLFGFSRGAYTVRSLAGLIRNSGLLKQEYASMSKEAFSLYRDRDPAKHPNSDGAALFRQHFSHDPVSMECVGVWDTVGALGIPLGIFEKLNQHQYSFHDTTLSSRVKNAFHALAIDERRKPFAPTLWVQPKEDADENRNWLEQAWFTGVHSNVGGGYADPGLSDVAYTWMIDRVEARTGLRFNRDYVNQIAKPNYLGQLYDSMNLAFKSLGEFERYIDNERAKYDALGMHTWEYVHESAKKRLDATKGRHDEYNPPNLGSYVSREAPRPFIGDTLPSIATTGNGGNGGARATAG